LIKLPVRRIILLFNLFFLLFLLFPYRHTYADRFEFQQVSDGSLKGQTVLFHQKEGTNQWTPVTLAEKAPFLALKGSALADFEKFNWGSDTRTLVHCAALADKTYITQSSYDDCMAEQLKDVVLAKSCGPTAVKTVSKPQPSAPKASTPQIPRLQNDAKKTGDITNIPPKSDPELEKLLGPKRGMTEKALGYLLRREGLLDSKLFSEGKVKITSHILRSNDGKKAETGPATYATALHSINVNDPSQPPLFAKEGVNCREEAKKLQALNQRSLVRDQKKHMHQENSPTLPTISLMEKAIFYGPSQQECIVILQAAQGQEVNKFLEQEVFSTDPLNHKRIISLAEDLGTNIGALHATSIVDPNAPFESRYLVDQQKYKTERLSAWTHNDLKFVNMFYDPGTRKVTLIDNADFNKSPITTDISRFLTRSVRFFTNNETTHGQRPVARKKIEELEKELRHESEPEKQGKLRAQIKRRKDVLQACHEFVEATVKAYTSQFPPSRHKEIQDPLMAFAKECETTPKD
jgi:hypothetical protein